MTTNDPKDDGRDAALMSSARRSRTAARDIPRLLKEPLALRGLKSDAAYLLTASSRSEGVLRLMRDDPRVSHAPGSRIVLMPAGDQARPVRLVVECAAPPGGQPKKHQLYVRWALISAAGRRSYLAELLTELLGLTVSLNSERDTLPNDRILMFDAASRRIRALRLKGRGGSSRPAEETGEALPALSRHALAKTGPVESGPSGGTDRPLDWLMFERPTAAGRYELEGDRHDMKCSWVGFSRCRFEIDGQGPSMGTPLRVGVPTEPLLRGLVWLDGRVCLNTANAGHGSVVEVEWSDPPGMMPSGYRSLVAFCRMSTLKRLGGTEPQFIS